MKNKHILLFEEYDRILPKEVYDRVLPIEEWRIIADAIRNGITYKDMYDEYTFYLICSNANGIIDDEDLTQENLNHIADEIEKGKKYGSILNKPLNIIWDLQFDVM